MLHLKSYPLIIFAPVIYPSPPSTVMVTNTSTASITVSWSPVHLHAIGYEVTYTPANGSCNGARNGIVLLNSTNYTSILLSKLEENTLYIIYIRTKGLHGYGHFSERVAQRTSSSGMLECCETLD